MKLSANPDVYKIHRSERYRWRIVLLTLSLGLLLTIMVSLGIGISDISPLTVMKIVISNIPRMRNVFVKTWATNKEIIIVNLRLPRILLGAMVGVALAASGACLQGLFRNPMADPYVLGISSGAALGAAVSILLDLGFLNRFFTPAMAFIFALFTILIVYQVARVRARIETGSVLLVGIAVHLFLSALLSFLIYVSEEKIRGIIFWIMGGLWACSWNDFYIILPCMLLGIPVLLFLKRDLNIALVGKEEALSLGLDVERFTKIILVFTSLVTAGAVAISGCVGFVGLLAPHIMRRIVGPDYRVLLPTSCLFGAILVIWTDNFARTLIYPVELPLGIITGLVGAPFFLYLLTRKERIAEL